MCNHDRRIRTIRSAIFTVQLTGWLSVNFVRKEVESYRKSFPGPSEVFTEW